MKKSGRNGNLSGDESDSYHDALSKKSKKQKEPGG